MMPMEYEIYALAHPETGEVRYIGKANNSAKRLKRHLRDMRSLNRPIHCWLRKMIGEGHFPVMSVLERCTDWQEAERRLIAVSRGRGDRLLNVSDGGDHIPTPIVVRKENGQALVSRMRADPRLASIRKIKVQLANGLLHGWVSNKTRARMREAAAKRPDIFGSWAAVQDRAE